LSVIHARRSAAALFALPGASVRGVLALDRWRPSGLIPLARRQVCQAHLSRYFPAIPDAGKDLLLRAQLLGWYRQPSDQWHEVGRAQLSRKAFAASVAEKCRPRVNT
jgi:hypothetical protein